MPPEEVVRHLCTATSTPGAMPGGDKASWLMCAPRRKTRRKMLGNAHRNAELITTPWTWGKPWGLAPRHSPRRLALRREPRASFPLHPRAEREFQVFGVPPPGGNVL